MTLRQAELETSEQVIRGNPTISLPKLLLHVGIFALLFATDSWTFPYLNDAFRWIQKYVLNFDYFREMGHLYTTTLASLFIWKLAPSRKRAIPYLFAGVLLASGAMELMKPIIARERPNYTDGKTVFAAPFTSKSPSMPSGHATTAMANANALGLVFPQARPAFIMMGVFSGFSRVEQGKHFMSDVYLGFILGFLVTNAVALYWRKKTLWLDSVFFAQKSP